MNPHGGKAAEQHIHWTGFDQGLYGCSFGSGILSALVRCFRRQPVMQFVRLPVDEVTPIA
jgi:hypothetical protein